MEWDGMGEGLLGCGVDCQQVIGHADSARVRAKHQLCKLDDGVLPSVVSAICRLLCHATLGTAPSWTCHCTCSRPNSRHIFCLMDLRYLRTGRLDALLSYDELSQEMQAKRVFQVRTEVVAM